MSIIKWNPQSNQFPFSGLFNEFFRSDISDFINDVQGNIPAANITESDSYYQVELAVPGYSKENFSINLDKNLLILKGRKERKEEDVKYLRKEYSYEVFQRSFYLPQTADLEKITASYEDGILKVVIAKKEEAKVKPVREIKIS